MYRKLRFTLRYLLGNVADFDPACHAVPWESLPAVDRHMLHRFAVLMDDLGDSYAGYQFSRFFQVPSRPRWLGASSPHFYWLVIDQCWPLHCAAGW